MRYKEHKILILHGTKLQNQAVDAADIYRPVGRIGRLLRRIHEHLPVPFKEIWYDKWKNRIEKYDTFIIFDGLRGSHIIEYILQKKPHARIIVYYINKFRNNGRNHPNRFKTLPCECWSFDKSDCERFGLNHSPFCYDDVLADSSCRIAYDAGADSAGEQYDAFFIGVDKQRLKRLVVLNALLQEQRLKTKMIVKRSRNVSYAKCTAEEKMLLTDKGLPYSEIIRLIWQSKAIVEILESGQNGLTLRAMESLFFRKKLITDNADIVNYDFYKPENIFLLGIDEEHKLGEFLQSEYREVAEEIRARYTWENWLERFFR